MIMVGRYSCLQSRSNRTIEQQSSIIAIRDEIIRKGSKTALCFSTIFVLLFLLSSCVPQLSQLAATKKLNGEERALHALIDFLENLHNGEYAKAVQYYGGSYETMTDHNPDIAPNDHAALLRNACTLNGMQCLQAKVIGIVDKVPNEKYVFIVEFLNEDGTLFMLESCCGGEETSFPPKSVYHFLVKEVDQNKFVVVDTPPYVP